MSPTEATVDPPSPGSRLDADHPENGVLIPCRFGTVNLSGRVSRMQAIGSGHWGLLPTHATDFGPDSEFLGPGSSMLCGSDVIPAEVEEVIDLIVG
jgi:hypothetical protein